MASHIARPFSYSARRIGRALSRLTARGGGLPRFNYAPARGSLQKLLNKHKIGAMTIRIFT